MLENVSLGTVGGTKPPVHMIDGIGGVKDTRKSKPDSLISVAAVPADTVVRFFHGVVAAVGVKDAR